ncbi:MAG: UDP-N-acetylmuramate dehydrogenase [Verrucomicrobia bacterium]|nr:UDP-N-acetylmuramate dehydrogenase [Verrucomicrobiota bacterium]
MQQLSSSRLLSEVCTFGIGGPAQYFVEVRDIPQMQKVLQECSTAGIRYFILGKGSNCLFDSRGFQGAVLQNKIDFCSETSPGVFHVGAGYSFSLLGTQTAKQGWSGLEFASGIPATVGGAVFMNAGAQGMQTWEALTFVDYVDADGVLKRFSKEELSYSYRFSSFQRMQGAIVGVCFTLTPSQGARERQIQLLKARIDTQPYQEKSAGCVFKNPTCAAAALLIDRCGLKGYRIGGAKVSEIHANFLINSGGATSQDVLDLRTYVKDVVLQKMDVTLESEIYWISADGR